MDLQKAKGYLACESKPKVHDKFGNIFACSDQVFISSSFMCNGVNDCNVNGCCDELGLHL